MTASDPEGNPLTYTVSDPAEGILTGTAPYLTYTPNADISGSDSFTFSVSDGDLDSNTATVSITVNELSGSAPVANAGPNQTVVEGTGPVTLDGRASYDPDPGGAIASYAWTQISKGTSVTLTGETTVNPTFIAPDVTADETLTFQLIVNDGALNSVPDLVDITVTNYENQPPVADAGPNQPAVNEGSTVTLDGRASYDLNNDPITYLWTQIGGIDVTLSNNTIARPTFIAPDVTADETLTFQLIVNDGALNSVPDVVDITVITTTLVPAEISYRKSAVIDNWTGESYKCNGDGRFNPGERIELEVTVRNSGTEPATNVSVALSTINPNITTIPSPVDIPYMAGGEMASAIFVVEAEGTTPGDYAVDFTLDIIDDYNYASRSDTFQVMVTEPLYGLEASERRIDTAPANGIASDPKTASDANGNVYVIFKNTQGGGGIYLNRSSDYGATWQNADVRVDRGVGSAAIRTYELACDDNGNVYVVWQDRRDGLVYPYTYDIYFNCSNDYGVTWMPQDIRLNTNDASTWRPQLACDNSGNVYVVWYDLRYPKGAVFFNRSRNNGATWLGADLRVSSYNPSGPRYNELNPKIACDEAGNVYVVWYEDGNTYGTENRVLFNYSNGHGDSGTWFNDIGINRYASGYNAYNPDISCDENGYAYVAWKKSKPGSRDARIYFNYSFRYSNGFRSPWQNTGIELSASLAADIYSIFPPEIQSDDNGNVYAMWRGDGDIYFNRSYDNGATWENVIALNSNGGGAGEPIMHSDKNGKIYVAWDEGIQGSRDIYFNYSVDYGETWQVSDLRLDTDPASSADSYVPAITSDDKGNAYIAWLDNRNGYYGDIYLRAISTEPFPGMENIVDREGYKEVPLAFDVIGYDTIPYGPARKLTLFHDIRELTIGQNSNMSNATLSTPSLAGSMTTSSFEWVPPLPSADTYDPVYFVAKNPVSGRCVSQDVTITVQDQVTSTRTLTLGISPVDRGTVKINGGQITPGDYQYDVGTQLSLEAFPVAGWGFFQWTGSGVPSGSEQDRPLSITMGADKSATAEFVMYGDLDGDEAITIEDVLKAAKHLYGIIHLDPRLLVAANVDGTNTGVDTISIEDVLTIAKRLYGLITVWPVEE